MGKISESKHKVDAAIDAINNSAKIANELGAKVDMSRIHLAMESIPGILSEVSNTLADLAKVETEQELDRDEQKTKAKAKK